MMRIKRFFAAALILAMAVCLSPKAAQAAVPSAVYVGDEPVTTGYETARALPTGSGMSGTVTYDSVSGILTLDTVTVPNTSSHDNAAVHASGDLTIVLKGTNILTGPDAEASYGVHVMNGALTIRSFDGTAASLTATGGTSSKGASAGIFVMSGITIPDSPFYNGSANAAVIKAVGGTATGDASYGIRVQSGNTIAGGTVIAQGNDAALSAVMSLPSFGTGTWYQWRTSDATPPSYTRSRDTTLTLNRTETYVELTADPQAAYIRTQPQNKTVTEGSISGSLTVEAAGDPAGTPTYQWYMCQNTNKTGKSAIEYQTAASYAIPTGSPAGTYYFFCRANLNGLPVESNVATVTVTANPHADNPTADIPKTGDSAMPRLWAGLVLLAGAGLCVSAMRRRRKQNG